MRQGSNAAHDDRLDPGMREQRALVARAEASGALQIGWKAGFGSPAARQRFALEAPLVGALLDRTRLDPGSEVPIGSWRDARAEAEIAVLLSEDLDGAVTPDRVLGSIAALAPAIELVDVHPAPESPSEALAGNVFHRYWTTGEFVGLPRGHDLSGLVAHVSSMSADLEPVHDVEALTGSAAETLVEVARVGARHGRSVRRGDVVILGAIAAPSGIMAGGDFSFTLSGHPTIALSFTE